MTRLATLLPLLLFGALCHAQTAGSRPAGAKLTADTTFYTLANGVRLVVQVDREAPLVAMDVWVAAGSARETEETSGCAHFLEHLIFKGTAEQGRGRLDSVAEGYGAILNAETDRDWAHFFGTVSNRYWEPLFAELSLALQKPALDPKQIEIERRVILDEIARDDDIMIRAAHRRLFREASAYGPYSLPVTGTPESVRALTRDEIAAFHKQHYVGSGTVVVLVGNLNAERALQVVTRLWRDLPPGQPQSFPSIAPKPGRRIDEVVPVGIPDGRGVVAVAFPAPAARQFRETVVMDMLEALLTDQRIGRVTSALYRGQPMAENVRSTYVTSLQPGLLCVMITGRSGNLDAIENTINEQVRRLMESPLKPEELRAAKSRLLGKTLFESETYEGRAVMFGFYTLVAGHAAAAQYAEIIKSLTAEEIQDTARRFFDPKFRTTLLLRAPR